MSRIRCISFALDTLKSNGIILHFRINHEEKVTLVNERNLDK